MSDAGSKPEITHASADDPALLPDQTSGDSDARERRVSELRRRYLEGAYRVDATALSASILDKHLES